METYFYARTSTKKQSLTTQIELAISNCVTSKNVFKDQLSGTGVYREEWEKLKKKVKKGDTIIFQSIDRMARNREQGVHDYFTLLEKGVNLKFIIDNHLDTSVYVAKIGGIQEITTGNELIDTTVIKGIKDLIMGLAKEQIELAFLRAENEAERIRVKVIKGLAVSTKKPGRKPGETGNKKPVPVSDVHRFSNSFNGTLNNTQLARYLRVSRSTVIKWIKEVKEMK